MGKTKKIKRSGTNPSKEGVAPDAVLSQTDAAKIAAKLKTLTAEIKQTDARNRPPLLDAGFDLIALEGSEVFTEVDQVDTGVCALR